MESSLVRKGDDRVGASGLGHSLSNGHWIILGDGFEDVEDLILDLVHRKAHEEALALDIRQACSRLGMQLRLGTAILAEAAVEACALDGSADIGGTVSNGHST